VELKTVIVAHARVRGRKLRPHAARFSWCKPAQIPIVEAKNVVRKLKVSSVEFIGMDSPFQFSITAGLITAQIAACWFTKDSCYEICPF